MIEENKAKDIEIQEFKDLFSKNPQLVKYGYNHITGKKLNFDKKTSFEIDYSRSTSKTAMKLLSLSKLSLIKALKIDYIEN